MRIELHVFFHVDEHQDQLLPLIQQLLEKVNHMTQVTDTLQADIAAQGTVIDSAITLINGIPGLVSAAVQKALTDAGVDAAATAQAVQDAAATIESQTDALRTALTANTPSA